VKSLDTVPRAVLNLRHHFSCSPSGGWTFSSKRSFCHTLTRTGGSRRWPATGVGILFGLQQSTKVELIIYIKTAKKLGISAWEHCPILTPPATRRILAPSRSRQCRQPRGRAELELELRHVPARHAAPAHGFLPPVARQRREVDNRRVGSREGKVVGGERQMGRLRAAGHGPEAYRPAELDIHLQMPVLTENNNQQSAHSRSKRAGPTPDVDRVAIYARIATDHLT
jgi:hypothetical protein